MKPADRIFCAIDTTELDSARRLAGALAGHVGGFKLGKEFFTANGPSGVAEITALGMPVFLDLKFHDIPNTVAGAIRAAEKTGCLLTTIHASGGPAMVRAAADARSGDTPLILAVTVLTSLGEDDLAAVGQNGPVGDQVLRLAKMARENGADGLVASPREITRIRAALGPDCTLVVPGIRPAWAATGDQKRIMTPADAVSAGADYLVIGRPITQAAAPEDAADRIVAEIEQAAG